MVKVIETSIDQLRPDKRNFNKHTEYGMHLLEKSVEQFGLGRSVVLDKNDVIIGGNGVTETAAQKDLNRVIIVETDGTQLVAVRRTDIDINTKRGREMALADNSVGMANLDLDDDAIKVAADEFGFDPGDWGVDLENPDDKNGNDGGAGAKKYEIIIECKSEDEQIRIMTELSGKYDCRYK